MNMFGKLYRSQQFEKRARQRRGLTEGEALAIAARARRGEEGTNPASPPSSFFHPPSSLPLICARCDQLRLTLPLTFPQHIPTCPKRGTEPQERQQ
jgi:hypothetical protein